MVLVTILARDNDKPGNRELINFLKPNFTRLLNSGLTFDFKMVETADIPDLIKRGMDKLPVATIQGRNYASSVEIKSILMRYMAARTAQRAVKRDPEDDVRDFYASEMTSDAIQREKYEDGKSESKNELLTKYQEAVQERSHHDKKEMNKTSKARQPAPRDDNVEDEPRREQREKREKHIGADPNNADDMALFQMLEVTD